MFMKIKDLIDKLKALLKCGSTFYMSFTLVIVSLGILSNSIDGTKI